MPFVIPGVLLVLGLGGWWFTRTPEPHTEPLPDPLTQYPPGAQQGGWEAPPATPPQQPLPTVQPLPPDLQRVSSKNLNKMLGFIEQIEKNVIKATLIRAELKRRDPRVNATPQIPGVTIPAY